jgi:predicted nucleic acid-binding Zn ribbon protein
MSDEGGRSVAPERVGTVVAGLLERLGVAERTERAAVATDWERLVGPHIARVTVDVRVSGRTLFVEVVNAAWLSELNMMRHDLLRRINAGRRRARIEKIIFVQAGGRARGVSRTSGGPTTIPKRG